MLGNNLGKLAWKAPASGRVGALDGGVKGGGAKILASFRLRVGAGSGAVLHGSGFGISVEREGGETRTR
jgi:hypothetical protein